MTTRVVALPTEVRYPLDLTERSAEIRGVYRAWCADRWDPEDLVDPERIRAVGGDPATRAAAGLVWSHRSWIAYRDISASEAAVVRLCLERDRDADSKYLLTARAATAARTAETCWLVADALEGYEPAPPAGPMRDLLDVDVARRLLDAAVDVDAAIAAHVIVGDVIQLAMWDAAAAGPCAPTVAAVIARLRTDAALMVRFGAAFVARNLGGLDPGRRAAVGAAVAGALAEEERGLRAPGPAAERAVDGGYGAATAEAAAAARRSAVAAVRTALGARGIEVPVTVPPIGVAPADAPDPRGVAPGAR